MCSDIGDVGGDPAGGRRAFVSLDPGKFDFIDRSCDFCSSSNLKEIHSFRMAGFLIQFSRCDDCGLIFQNPSLSKEARAHVYESQEYWEFSNVTDGDEADKDFVNYDSYIQEEPLRRINAAVRAKRLSKELPEGARIMDIGCSDGVFVDVLNAHGFKAEGIDISSTMVDYGRKSFGANVTVEDFEGQGGDNRQFDAITCFATLSNFVNPSLVFANIARNLKPGGMFYFNFADYTRWLSRLLASRFYVYRLSAGTIYTADLVRQYCATNGMTIDELKTDRQSMPVARILGLIGFERALALLYRAKLDHVSVTAPLYTGYIAVAHKTGKLVSDMVRSNALLNN